MNSVTIVGAGLAGCEAALQLASNGYYVKLIDAKPILLGELYSLPTYAELVCNNALGSINENKPLGLLIKELKCFDSKIIDIAEKCRVSDCVYYSIDKKKFSLMITNELYRMNVKVISDIVTSVPDDDNVIIATGPLTNGKLISDLSYRYGIKKYFFSDASSPIIDIKSVDINAKNVQQVTKDLYIIQIPYHEFQKFYKELLRQSNKNVIHARDMKINYAKCQSIEKVAEYGIDDLYRRRFNYRNVEGPCLLLRRETALEDGFILVGCMTTLNHAAQTAVFSKLPALENCKFIKFGRMHHNTYLNSPEILNEFFQIRGSNVFVIGQLSGVDGYAPAIASGLVASIRILHGSQINPIPTSTMIGGLARYVSNSDVVDFQPMCASFSLIDKVNNKTTNTILDYIFNLKAQC